MISKPPTVFKDCRGEIRKIKFHGVEVNLVYTKAGALRSGDVHPNRQHDLVLFGGVTIRTPKDGVYPYYRGDHCTVGPGVPHLFQSVTDSVVLEWWDGPFKAKYYRPYRKLVEKWIREHSK